MGACNSRCRSALIAWGCRDRAAKSGQRRAQLRVANTRELAIDRVGLGGGNRGSARARRGVGREWALDEREARRDGAAEIGVDPFDDEGCTMLQGERLGGHDAQSEDAARAQRFGPGDRGKLGAGDLGPGRLDPGGDPAAAFRDDRRGEARGGNADCVQPWGGAQPRLALRLASSRGGG